MSARAHIRNGVLIKRYSGEKGKMQLENGDTVAGIKLGFEKGNDKVVPVIQEETDISTGPDTVVVFSAWAENDNRWYRTKTTRDKTRQEIDDDAAGEVQRLRDLLKDPGFQIQNSIDYRIAKGGPIPASALESKSNWNAWVDNVFVNKV